jgi:hypothetical protein
MRAQDAFAAKGEGQQIIPDEGSLGSHTRRGLRMTLGKPPSQVFEKFVSRSVGAAEVGGRGK